MKAKIGQKYQKYQHEHDDYDEKIDKDVVSASFKSKLKFVFPLSKLSSQIQFFRRLYLISTPL